MRSADLLYKVAATSGGKGVAEVALNKPSSFYIIIEGMVKQVNGSTVSLFCRLARMISGRNAAQVGTVTPVKIIRMVAHAVIESK